MHRSTWLILQCFSYSHRTMSLSSMHLFVRFCSLNLSVCAVHNKFQFSFSFVCVFRILSRYDFHSSSKFTIEKFLFNIRSNFAHGLSYFFHIHTHLLTIVAIDFKINIHLQRRKHKFSFVSLLFCMCKRFTDSCLSYVLFSTCFPTLKFNWRFFRTIVFFRRVLNVSNIFFSFVC